MRDWSLLAWIVSGWILLRILRRGRRLRRPRLFGWGVPRRHRWRWAVALAAVVYLVTRPRRSDTG